MQKSAMYERRQSFIGCSRFSHQAFLTEEALSNIAETTIDNLQRFFRGEPNPTTEVRYEDVAHI